MKNTQIIISVVIPAYNPQSYIYECLSSLNKQSLLSFKYEVLIVLNGSKNPYYDNIIDYVSNYLQNLNVKLIYTEGIGVSNARNVGIDNAAGEYYCFIDDDDLISPNYLENLLEKATENTLSVADFRTFTSDISNLSFDYISKAFRRTKKENLFARRSFLSSSCGKLIHRDIVGCRRFFTNFAINEDALFMFLISDRITKIVLAHKDTIYYRRIRKESASRKCRTITWRIINTYRSVVKYVTVYFRNPFGYNLFYFISRIVGSLINIIR